MATAEQARLLLKPHGTVRPQLPGVWKGKIPLPAQVERFYREVGPVDLIIESGGDTFFLPRLSALWKFQAGYRWNGLSGDPIEGWDDDWLVVADQGGDPFIVSRNLGAVQFAQHGAGAWEPTAMFPDLNTMAACLGQVGSVVASAGDRLTDAAGRIRPEYRKLASSEMRELVPADLDVEAVLAALGW